MDYYQVFTGDCELVSMKNPRDESETLHFYKLKNPGPVISCVDCLARPEIQKQVEVLFSSIP